MKRKAPTPSELDARLLAVLSRVQGKPPAEVAQQMKWPDGWEKPHTAHRVERQANNVRLAAHADPPTDPTKDEAPELLEPERRRERAPHWHPESERGVPAFSPLGWLRVDYARAAHLRNSVAACRRSIARLPPRLLARLKLCIYAYERNADGVWAPTRTLEHIAARSICALAMTAWHVSNRTTRDGMERVIDGRSRGSWASLLKHPTHGKDGARGYSISRLYATQHHRAESIWDCGHMVALHRAGFFRRHQPPASVALRQFVGRARDGSLRALNQYWFRASFCEAQPAHTESVLSAWLAELQALAMKRRLPPRLCEPS